jgi:drug/metabolite transporter (DMT)-like permease
LFIKIAIPEIPPITLVLLRVAIAALILSLVCRLQRQPRFDWKRCWRQALVLGLTLNALPFVLISFAELFITSSLAGILNSLTLIFTALFAHFFGKEERFTRNKAFGIILGIIGLAIIYLPGVLQQGIKSSLGVFLIIVACISYGGGAVYARSQVLRAPGIVVLTAQLILTTIVLIPFSLFIDRPYALPWPGLEAIGGALGLGVIGTALGFSLYYKAIQLAGATYASFSVLFVPILAMILGAFFLHEQLTWNLYLGTLLILVGVTAVNPTFNKT